MQLLQPIENTTSHTTRTQLERVVVINDISVLKGGATSVALTSAEQLSELGIPVTYITGDDADQTAPEHAAIDFVALGERHILDAAPVKAALNGLYNSRTETALSEWIARHDTPGTIYHLHGWSKILSPSIFRALQPVDNRLAIHAHDYFLVCPNGGFFDFQKREVCDRQPLSFSCLTCQCDKRNYLQKIWRCARQEVRQALINLTRQATVIPVHEGMLRLLAKGGIPLKRMKVLRNPVEAWRLDRVAAERNRRFLFVGRLEDDKGVLALARAARRADIQLSMAGVGPLEERLRQTFPEIELLGWQNKHALAELSRSARALVMPSLWRETFGLVAFEAMLSGIPVVVSDRVMIAEEVTANKFGLSGNPENEQGFAALLSRVRDDDELVARFSRAAYTEARKFAPDATSWCNDLLGIYNSILDNPTNARQTRR